MGYNLGGGGGGAAGSIVVGNAVTGGAANAVLYEDGSQNLAASANFTFDGTNATIASNGAFIFGSTSLGYIGASLTQTPDAPILSTGVTSNSIHMRESGDSSFDFQNGPGGTSACSDPTLIIHSHNQSTTEWLALYHDGTNGRLQVGAGAIESSNQFNISGPDATTNVEIGSVANDANAGTGGTSVVIGNAATNSGNGAGNIAIGSGATTPGAGSSQISIGTGATANGNNSNITLGSSSTGGGGITIGTSSTGGTTPSTVIAHSATGAQNAFVGGSTSYTINNIYFGRGITSTTAASNGAVTYNGTGGSGSDNAGGNITLAAGQGTGTAAGGDLRLQTSPSIATGSTAQTLSDCYLIRAQKKTLTESTATPFVRVNIASGVAAVTGWTGGTVFYTIVANDATDFQSRSGSFNFSIVNKGGTETAVLGTVSAEAAALSSGTLSVTFDTDTSPTNAVDIRANAVSSLTQTTLAMFYSVIMNGPGTLTPQ